MLRLATFLMLALALAATTASAQLLDLTQNRGGFFGGVNFAGQGGDMDALADATADALEEQFGGNWNASTGRNIGFGVGGYYVLQVSPTVGFELEGQYIRRGAKIDFADNITAGFHIDYLEFPLLARFSPQPTAGVRPIFLLGPVIGIKTGANLKVTIEDEITGQEFDSSQDMSGEYEDLNVGLLGGIGFSARATATTYVVLQARYFLGLTDPIKDETFEAKSGDFGVFVGLEFTPRQ